jgi:gamma-glutamyltranspeptidase
MIGPVGNQSTLVMKDGRPLMVLGSPGGDDQCMRTMQTFLNLVEFGMNVQQAIEAPRWSTRTRMRCRSRSASRKMCARR